MVGVVPAIPAGGVVGRPHPEPLRHHPEVDNRGFIRQVTCILG